MGGGGYLWFEINEFQPSAVYLEYLLAFGRRGLRVGEGRGLDGGSVFALAGLAAPDEVCFASAAGLFICFLVEAGVCYWWLSLRGGGVEEGGGRGCRPGGGEEGTHEAVERHPVWVCFAAGGALDAEGVEEGGVFGVFWDEVGYAVVGAESQKGGFEEGVGGTDPTSSAVRVRMSMVGNVGLGCMGVGGRVKGRRKEGRKEG